MVYMHFKYDQNTTQLLVEINIQHSPAVLSPPQHVVFLVKFFVAWMIPDVPSDVRARVKRERYLVQEYLHNYEVEKLKIQLSQNSNDCTCTPMIYPSLPRHEVLSECL